MLLQTKIADQNCQSEKKRHVKKAIKLKNYIKHHNNKNFVGAWLQK